MNNVLFLHHFEVQWEEGLKGFDTNLDDITNKVIDFLSFNDDIDLLLITQMENNQAEEEHSRLINFCQNKNIEVRFQEYAYAMYRDLELHDEENEESYVPYPMEKFGETWTYGTRSHHDNETDVLDIEDFHYELKNANKVYLAGAFEGECVLDQEAILDAIDAEYTKVDELVVGTYVDYEFKFRDVIIENTQNKINEITNELEDCDFEQALEDEPEQLKITFEKIISLIEENEENFEILAGAFESHVGWVDEAVDSFVGGYFDEFQEEKLEFIEKGIEIKNHTATEEGLFYRSGVINLDNDETIELPREKNEQSNEDTSLLHCNESKIEKEIDISCLKEDSYSVVFKIQANADSFRIDLNEYDEDHEFEMFDQEFSLEDIENAAYVLDNESYDALLLVENDEKTLLLVNDSIYSFDDVVVKANIDGQWTDYVELHEIKDVIEESITLNLKQDIKQTLSKKADTSIKKNKRHRI